MTKFVCCGLILEATILKKRDQIYNESAKFELPEKDAFLWFMLWQCPNGS